ncbi:TNF receptor-associated factor 4-like [Dysidea avara]|uniref:TNF receptor-associated factor 4-like n=1 Tax=Dysidea avara TaxID=196820 RepID=UPI00332AA9D6
MEIDLVTQTTQHCLGGYDHKFVAAPHDRFVCKICDLPCRDSQLTVCCGHNLCKSCLDNVKKTTEVCPLCRDGQFFTVPNKQADREIRSLYVMCTNNERGCEWQGEVNNINNHLLNDNGCQYMDINCPNECGKLLQRQGLTSHVEADCSRRKIECQYCNIRGEHQFIENKHKEQCSKLPLPCPNDCQVGTILREDMEAHRKECPLEMIQCQYHNVGCEVGIVRNKRKAHEEESTEEHLQLTKSKLAKTEELMSERINNLELVVNQLISKSISVDKIIAPAHSSIHLITTSTLVCPVTMKMSQYNKYKRSGNSSKWYSDSFYSHNNGYKMSLYVLASGHDAGKGTHMSVFLVIMKGPYDDELSWPLRGAFEIGLLNQISDSNHHSCPVTYDDDTPDETAGRVIEGMKAAYGHGVPLFISNEDLFKNTSTCQYIKDECIFIQVSKL